MPIHDWTRVEAGIFHDFHHTWIAEIKRALNAGLLPSECYALAEQIAGGMGPDVLTVQRPPGGALSAETISGGAALATALPQVQYHLRSEQDVYASKAKAVVIRYASNHRVIAVVEIFSPGNKSGRHALRAFVDKAVTLLRAGIHLLILDLFPPGPRDPQGIHKPIWDNFIETDFAMTAGRPLTFASYLATTWPEAFVQTTSVGEPLHEMAIFLTQDDFIRMPLEETYMTAWEAVPAFWRDVLTAKLS